MTVKECPECGAEIDEGNVLIVRQKFSQTVTGKMDTGGHISYEDYDDDLLEDKMLAEGVPEIQGCEICVSRCIQG